MDGVGYIRRDTFGSQGRFFINAIAESPEVVAADVVPRMRELVSKPGARKGNAAVRFLTPDKAITKLYRRIAKVRVEVVSATSMRARGRAVTHFDSCAHSSLVPPTRERWHWLRLAPDRGGWAAAGGLERWRFRLEQRDDNQINIHVERAR